MTRASLSDFLIRYPGNVSDVSALHKYVYDSFLAQGQSRQFIFSPVDASGTTAIVIRGEESLLKTIAPQAKLTQTFIPGDGDSVPFTLRANPQYKSGMRRSQMPTFASWDAKRLAWLERRGAERGFSVSDVEMEVTSHFVKEQKNRKFIMNVVTFSGMLHVFDEDLLRASMGNGIGRAITYGNGLLLCYKQ